MINTYENWIFDWSGTVVDDMALVIDATNYVMRQYGKEEFTREAFKSSFRLPYGEWYEEVIPGVELAEIEDHFRKGFELSGAEVPVLDHARELLELLSSKQKRLFVCTSMDPKAFLEQAKDHGLLPFFEETFSGVLDKRQLIEEMIQQHHLEKSKTVFVGDMIHDIETAHHGQISSLAVLTGYNTREELSSVNPTYLLESFESLVLNSNNDSF